MQLNGPNAKRQEVSKMTRTIVWLMCMFCTTCAASTLIAGEQPVSDSAVNLPVLAKPGMADELIYVNFDQVDIRVMLKTIGDITGINFVVDDSIRGTVTVMSPTKIRLGEIYEVLESILEVNPTFIVNRVKPAF